MKVLKHKNLKRQIRKLLTKINRGQSSVNYHSRKINTINRELKDNVSLIKTSISMLFHSLETSPETHDESSDEESSNHETEPCTSNSLRKKNEERSQNPTILISDTDDLTPSPKSLHLSTFLGTPDPTHIRQPFSQDTMNSISRLLNHQTPSSPVINKTCELTDCRDPTCRNSSYDSDEV